MVCVIVVAGCSGIDRRTIRLDVAEGRYVKAERALNDLCHRHLDEFGAGDETTGLSTHALLWRFERGLVDHIQGEHANALAHFQAAWRLGRELRTASVGREAATLLVNDNLRRYRGEPVEHAYAAGYAMLDNLFLAQRVDGTWLPPAPSGGGGGRREPPLSEPAEVYADRAVSCSAALTDLQRETAEQQFGASDYREDAFLHFLTAAVRHAAASDGDDRQDAALAGERAAALWAHGGVPEAARILLPRIAAAAGRTLPGLPVPPLSDGLGTVLVLEEIGYVPKREALQVYALTGAAPPRAHVDIGGVFVYVNNPAQGRDLNRFFSGVVLPGELVRRLTGGRIGVFGFEVPVLPYPRRRPPAGVVTGDGLAATALTVAADVERQVRTCYDDHRARRLITIITRTVAKLVAVRQGLGAAVPVERRNGQRKAEAEFLRDVLWGLGSLAVTASEQADTRCWSLLPDRIAAAAIDLPAGRRRLAIQRSDGGVQDLGEVDVRPGRLLIVGARTFAGGAGDLAGPED